QDRTVAKPLHRLRVVRDEDDRPTAAFELGDLGEALTLVVLVADGEDLVEEQDVGLDVRGNRESESHEHSRRVRAYRQIDEALELGERDDLGHRLANPRAGEPVDGAVQVDVLTSAEIGMEARAQLEQRADASAGLDASRRRAEDAGQEPQQRRLPRAVSPDEP